MDAKMYGELTLSSWKNEFNKDFIECNNVNSIKHTDYYGRYSIQYLFMCYYLIGCIYKGYCDDPIGHATTIYQHSLKDDKSDDVKNDSVFTKDFNLISYNEIAKKLWKNDLSLPHDRRDNVILPTDYYDTFPIQYLFQCFLLIRAISEGKCSDSKAYCEALYKYSI